MGKIFWLFPAGDNPTKKRTVVVSEMHRFGVKPTDIVFAQPRNARKFENLWAKPAERSSAYKFDPLIAPLFLEWLDGELKRHEISIIVCNDTGLLPIFTGDTRQTMVTHRGFVYHYRGLPVICVDDVNKTFIPGLSMNNAIDLWILRQDIAKIVRHYTGKARKMPIFQYEIVDTTAVAMNICQKIENEAAVVAFDTETSGGYIAVNGVAYLDKAGKFYSYVFAFADTTDGVRFTPTEETLVWTAIQSICDKCCVVFHNGNYDIQYFNRYGIKFNGGIADTLIMWHAIWAELPKALDFCASILLDGMSYWKDEVKEERDEMSAKYAVPQTQRGFERYCQYNALDVYVTLLVAMKMAQLLNQPTMAWAKQNYQMAMLNQYGPAMMMQVLGMQVDNDRRMKLINGYRQEAADALEIIHSIMGTHFNPLSSKQVVTLFYDLLGDARPVKRGAPSVDKKVMDRVAEVAPLHAYMWRAIQKYKKPVKQISMYGEDFALSPSRRFHFSLSTTATWTARYGSKANAFGMGTNSQNMPKTMRTMCVADPDYVFLDADYGQSDLWFVAYEAGDENLIKVLNSGIDVHAYHVEQLLGVAYDQVVKWRKLGPHSGDPEWKKKRDFIEDPITGVRQIIKKVVHGTNYVMGPGTMFANIGRPALVAAAVAAGYADAYRWNNQQCVTFCGKLQERYFKLYPGVAKWRVRVIGVCASNGNKATAFGGRTHMFFNAPGMSGAAAMEAHRALVSFYGQGGTSGNINRALIELFWSSDVFLQGVRLYNQVHDNLVFGIPLTKLHLSDNVLAIMASQVSIGPRNFTVPIEAEFSFVWADKDNVSWKPGMDYEKLRIDLLELRKQQLGA